MNELYKTQQNSIADLSLNQQKFAADSIKNERDRLKAQREVLEEQKKNELARLQSQVDAYAEGTQDRINAEIEYNTKKQELDQALATNATALTEAEIARNLELNTLRAQNDLENSAQRIKLLELEYAEKERLANGDNEKIIELEKEKQRKILQIEAEAKDAKLGLAIEGLTVLSDFTGLFAKKNEASAKRAFQIQKGLSIAQAVMETYKDANAIFTAAANNPGTILFPGQPFVAAGLAIAAGLANVAKIASQKFEGGGAPAGGGGWSGRSR